MTSPHLHLPAGRDAGRADGRQSRLFSDDPAVDGLLIQHPDSRPPRLRGGAGATSIPTRTSTARTRSTWAAWRCRCPGPLPCTPAGIEALLAHYEIPVAGRHVVIVGRGFTLGRPLSLLMSAKRPHTNAAVDHGAHRRAQHVRLHARGRHPHRRRGRARHHPARARQAGLGRHRCRRELRRARTADRPTSPKSAKKSPGWITPRVGGVGPTTIAMLFRNCIEAAERRVGWRD